ncbi:hypothetical protein M878_19910 [Streptomyces roseochromogenus subsp. oscitans DS 12.976]|uniref:Uncharacterized protein n=1 Tax=Streptomyces roseochromogenus subsp. oscitans DS 12.976 TaxID=1352936 RepID=V6KBX3_STRRC|nr:hypothetical protein M878_19910 [Streptomyces roseochromogenus subsp. oscitans DS 12.976]
MTGGRFAVVGARCVQLQGGGGLLMASRVLWPPEIRLIGPL